MEASPDSSRGGGGSTVLWRVVERDRESEEGESEAEAQELLRKGVLVLDL